MWYNKSARKAGDKRKPDYTARLDRIFSLYIRLRDSSEYGHRYFKCISCGRVLPISKADAGHYMSRRHQSTRFDEDNVHAECSYDNRFNAEHLDGFRDNLIKKIGRKRFDMLRIKANGTKHYSDFELKELIKYYTGLVNKMKSEI